MKNESDYAMHTRSFYDAKTILLAAAFLLALLLIIVLYKQSTSVKADDVSISPLSSQSTMAPCVAVDEPFRTTYSQVLVDMQTAPAVIVSSVDSAPVTSQPHISLAPLCFSGEPGYAYNDDRLAIHIQKKQEINTVYFVCDIQTTDPSALRTALSGGIVNGDNEHTSDIAVRSGAVLAINGDCYSFHSNGTIIRNGKIIRSNKTTRHLLAINEDGDFSIFTDRNQQDAKLLGDTLLRQKVTQAWEFGPELIRDGQAISLNKSNFDLLSTRDGVLEPRTAIGQIGPLHYVIIVVDGRIDGYSDGASLSTLQRLFREAGAQTAFNLDGGGSTTLYFNGTVINRPSGGHERSVSDIIYF